MCEVNWLLLLEYIKVILSWPPMAVLIAGLVIWRFRTPISDFLNRSVEANIFGQAIKAVPPREQQQKTARASEDPIAKAAEEQIDESAKPAQALQLPPELANDPQAAIAVAWVQNNPATTVIEYRRLLFSYNAERLFNSIFGTQIWLLNFLASRPDNPANLTQLAPFHEVHQKLSGTTNYQIGDYVNFLVSFGVIVVGGSPEEPTYRISDYGLRFLSYIKANYPAGWNSRAL